MREGQGITIFLSMIVVVLMIFAMFPRVSADTAGVEYLIGMSQCNLGEPWRIKMNNDLTSAAEKYPNIKLIFTDAAQNNDKQIKDIRKLMKLGIDLLIVSPNESEPLTPVISEINKQIPVIILDRKIDNDDYTLFIGADNYDIGASAGDYVKNLLGKTGGNIVEIAGLPGSRPTVERSEGFRQSVSTNTNIKIIEYIAANWLRDEAEDGFREYLLNNPEQRIDVVYAHNDPMALGAYKAAKGMGLEENIVFIGIDGLTTEEGGINLVKKGIINITFIYPTGGEEAIEYAVRLLQGEKFENKQLTLEHRQIDR